MHALTVEILRRLQKGDVPFALIERWTEAGCPDLPDAPVHEEDALTLGHALRRARECAGLTQRDVRRSLAELDVEVGAAMVSRWEANMAMPDARELATVLNLYDADASQVAQVFELARACRRAG